MSDLGNLLKHIGVVSNLNTEDSVLEYILTGHEPGATVYSDRDIAAAQVKERPGPFSRSLSEALGSSWPEIGTLTEAEIVQSLEDDSKELGIPLDELKDIKSREVHALMQANAKTATRADLEASIDVLSDIAAKRPKYASAFNNRAQARQLLAIFIVRAQEKEDAANAGIDLSSSPAAPADAAPAPGAAAAPAAEPAVPISDAGRAALKKARLLQTLAMSDLNNAIMVCSELYSRRAAAAGGDDSGYRPPRALLQAFCQRAALHRLRGNDQFALEDIHRAAELGSAWAQKERVALHPVARLNNEMLGEILEANTKGAASKGAKTDDA